MRQNAPLCGNGLKSHLSSANAFNLDQSRNLSFGKELIRLLSRFYPTEALVYIIQLLSTQSITMYFSHLPVDVALFGYEETSQARHVLQSARLIPSQNFVLNLLSLLVISIYLSSLPFAHLRDTPIRDG